MKSPSSSTGGDADSWADLITSSDGAPPTDGGSEPLRVQANVDATEDPVAKILSRDC